MDYFEDLVVGRIERFGSYTVTRAEVLEFAARYDPQPFHLDDAEAALTPFGRLAASGWHTCAMVMGMLVRHWQSRAVASLGSPGIDLLRWPHPVYPGDTLSVEAELLEKRRSRSRPDLGLTRSRTTGFNQHGVVVVNYIATGMFKVRDPAAPIEG